MHRRVAAVLALLVAALAGCTKHQPPTTVTTHDVTQTRVVTETSAPHSFTPAPAASVAPLPPGQDPPRGEVDKACPYIRPGLNIDGYNEPDSVAELEGDRVYRMTVLTKLKPVGCRFYFIAPPYEAVADIQPRTFATATEAHNAMVLTATKTGTDAIGRPNFVPGVDAILYRTKFFGPDGGRDWACAFAKGTVMVVVHTQQNDVSLNALRLAQAIVGKF
jgi:hypothetical protein